MKNPGQKIGNDVWCHLPNEAWAILHSMPKSEREIFPYNARSVSASFTHACPLLEIGDLHFHDLRHEGVSRLFEMDWDIPRVSSVSGDRDWNSLRRYTFKGARRCLRGVEMGRENRMRCPVNTLVLKKNNG